MLGVLDMITKLTLPILLINKLIFLKTMEQALKRLLLGAIHL